MSIRGIFSNSIAFKVINKYGAAMQISTIFGLVYHDALWRVLWEYLDIYLTMFSDLVISEIQNLWGSSFKSKYSKHNQYFRNGEKNSENFFSFWDNCIWICFVKLSLLRKGYLSSAANVSKRCPKTWHVNKRDFFPIHLPWK